MSLIDHYDFCVREDLAKVSLFKSKVSTKQMVINHDQGGIHGVLSCPIYKTPRLLLSRMIRAEVIARRHVRPHLGTLRYLKYLGDITGIGLCGPTAYSRQLFGVLRVSELRVLQRFVKATLAKIVGTPFQQCSARVTAERALDDGQIGMK